MAIISLFCHFENYRKKIIKSPLNGVHSLLKSEYVHMQWIMVVHSWADILHLHSMLGGVSAAVGKLLILGHRSRGKDMVGSAADAHENLIVLEAFITRRLYFLKWKPNLSLPLFLWFWTGNKAEEYL